MDEDYRTARAQRGWAAAGNSHEHTRAGQRRDSHEHGEGFGGRAQPQSARAAARRHHEPDYENGLSIAENNVLMALSERGALPVAQFSLTSSREAQAYAVAMEPVYVARAEDSLEDIREYGALFAGLEEKGLIDIDYDFPCPATPTANTTPPAPGDALWRPPPKRRRAASLRHAKLELGAITLTQRGEETVDGMFA
jgi:hypothetical protein